MTLRFGTTPRGAFASSYGPFRPNRRRPRKLQTNAFVTAAGRGRKKHATEQSREHPTSGRIRTVQSRGEANHHLATSDCARGWIEPGNQNLWALTRSSRGEPILSATKPCFASLRRSQPVGNQKSYHEFSPTDSSRLSVSIIST